MELPLCPKAQKKIARFQQIENQAILSIRVRGKVSAAGLHIPQLQVGKHMAEKLILLVDQVPLGFVLQQLQGADGMLGQGQILAGLAGFRIAALAIRGFEILDVQRGASASGSKVRPHDLVRRSVKRSEKGCGLRRTRTELRIA